MQPGPNQRDGTPFRPRAPADDFLGLGAELGRAVPAPLRPPEPPPALPHAAMPARSSADREPASEPYTQQQLRALQQFHARQATPRAQPSSVAPPKYAPPSVAFPVAAPPSVAFPVAAPPSVAPPVFRSPAREAPAPRPQSPLPQAAQTTFFPQPRFVTPAAQTPYVAPQRATPQSIAPSHVVPKQASPSHVAPQHASPLHTASSHTAPSHNSHSHNAPSHNAPLHNAPLHAAQSSSSHAASSNPASHGPQSQGIRTPATHPHGAQPQAPQPHVAQTTFFPQPKFAVPASHGTGAFLGPQPAEPRPTAQAPTRSDASPPKPQARAPHSILLPHSDLAPEPTAPVPQADVRAPTPTAPSRPGEGRFRSALPPRATVLMPAQESLHAPESLAGNWPEVRPNTWRIDREPAPAPLASIVASNERASWLLALDDGAIPPAHPSFVATAVPSNASFRDGTEIVENVAPWFVRALCVFAGLFLCAVITRTVLLRVAHPPAEPAPPVQPIARALPRAEVELAAPGDAGATTRPGGRPHAPDASLASALALGPESPALVVYDLPAPAVEAVPGADAALDPAGVDRWLAAQSRTSAPLADAGAVRAGDPDAAAASPTAKGSSGIWEGATIPVEAISGGLRLQTPGVGRVRVRLEGGTRVEGRLTAIGQSRVWVETESGPVEVESAKMRGLEQIAERGAETGPQSPRRQRVRTAGGVFYGRVLARDGHTVTMITDAGARVTVEADEIVDADGN